MKSASMGREELESWLRDTIVELEDRLTHAQIVGSASLFQDLGFDSLAFERLLGAIEEVMDHKDLSAWYANTTESGDDSLNSLVDFLLGDADAQRSELAR